LFLLQPPPLSYLKLCTQSVNHSQSSFDALGTEALALQNYTALHSTTQQHRKTQQALCSEQSVGGYEKSRFIGDEMKMQS